MKDRPRPSTVGARIAQARLDYGAARGKGMTQTELARIVGVLPATVSQWEADSVTPALPTVPKIAAALGVSAGFIAFGEVSSSFTPRPETDERIDDDAIDAEIARRAALKRPTKRANRRP